MEELVILLVIIILLGAFAGGKSFGDTISKGCGCLILLLVIGLVLAVFVWPSSRPDIDKDKSTPRSLQIESGYYEVVEECQTYKRPNIESDTLGTLDFGNEFRVENVNQYNYFYKISDENGKTIYVRKECLQKVSEWKRNRQQKGNSDQEVAI